MIMIVHQVIYYRVGDSVDDVDVDKSSLSRLASATVLLMILLPILLMKMMMTISKVCLAYTVGGVFHNTDRF